MKHIGSQSVARASALAEGLVELQVAKLKLCLALCSASEILNSNLTVGSMSQVDLPPDVQRMPGTVFSSHVLNAFLSNML